MATEKVGSRLKHAASNDAGESLEVLQGLGGETTVFTPEETKLLRKMDYRTVGYRSCPPRDPISPLSYYPIRYCLCSAS